MGESTDVSSLLPRPGVFGEEKDDAVSLPRASRLAHSAPPSLVLPPSTAAEPAAASGAPAAAAASPLPGARPASVRPPPSPKPAPAPSPSQLGRRVSSMRRGADGRAEWRDGTVSASRVDKGVLLYSISFDDGGVSAVPQHKLAAATAAFARRRAEAEEAAAAAAVADAADAAGGEGGEEGEEEDEEGNDEEYVPLPEPPQRGKRPRGRPRKEDALAWAAQTAAWEAQRAAAAAVAPSKKRRRLPPAEGGEARARTKRAADGAPPPAAATTQPAAPPLQAAFYDASAGAAGGGGSGATGGDEPGVAAGRSRRATFSLYQSTPDPAACGPVAELAAAAAAARAARAAAEAAQTAEEDETSMYMGVYARMLGNDQLSYRSNRRDPATGRTIHLGTHDTAMAAALAYDAACRAAVPPDLCVNFPQPGTGETRALPAGRAPRKKAERG